MIKKVRVAGNVGATRTVALPLLPTLLTIGCLLPLPSSAQQLSFGLKGGYSLTDSENKTPSFILTEAGAIGSYDSSRRTYLVGGTVEVSLPFGLSLEGDFLYHPYNLRLTSTGLAGIGTYVDTSNSNVFGAEADHQE